MCVVFADFSQTQKSDEDFLEQKRRVQEATIAINKVRGPGVSPSIGVSRAFEKGSRAHTFSYSFEFTVLHVSARAFSLSPSVVVLHTL